MTRSLEGKKALVTGAGVRVGRAIAVDLARLGCDVIVHYFKSEKGARDCAQEISALERTAHLIREDLRDPAAPERIAAFVQSSFGALDILINSASTYPDPGKKVASSHFLEESLERWEEALAANARAPFFLTQKLVPLLEKGSSPCVINILDLSVSQVKPSRSAHVVSKRVLAAVTDVAAHALGSRIRVNGIELGRVIPHDNAEESKQGEWGLEGALHAVRFVLASPFLNGEVIHADGVEIRRQ